MGVVFCCIRWTMKALTGRLLQHVADEGGVGQSSEHSASQGQIPHGCRQRPWVLRLLRSVRLVLRLAFCCAGFVII